MSNNNIDFSSIDWYAILPRLGVPLDLIEKPKKLGPCPIELDGKTRFRFDNKGGRGTWLCNSCGAGDGVRLVALVNGTDDTGAVWLIREVIEGGRAEGISFKRSTPVPKEKRSREDIDKAVRRLQEAFDRSVPIEGTPAMEYLKNRIRGLRADWLNMDAFRFHSNLYHFDEETSKKSWLLGMLASVENAATCEGTVTYQRYYITKDGQKAKVSPSQAKKMMSAKVEKLHGESIRVNNAPAGPVIIVSEGLENGLPWMMATQNRIPVYAALSANNLEHFIWPEGTEALLIAADHDHVNPKTGLRIGTHCAKLLKKRAVEAGLKVVIRAPRVPGIDWDDMWNVGEFPSVEWLFQPSQERHAETESA
ncbi:DUF7146 domain-containing protein [Hydrogenophaga sp. NFH-34]|uniref:DUF7146 domain-containing protein n=1 Tax=Hydrogenophaga sp. NFH-34 TaxID=2744446 RepID=UPI001F24BBF2|nr:toprim domain-containing protein [Hydrogenophaga sp. NFH-34]